MVIENQEEVCKSRTVSFSEPSGPPNLGAPQMCAPPNGNPPDSPSTAHQNYNRAGNVFESIDRRGESDRKVPRQARPIISRKDVEKSGPKNGEFRSRAQTAPVNTLKRRDLRKDRERMLQHMLDNNNDDSLDDGSGLSEVKVEKKTAAKPYRFAFKKTLMKENGIKDESAAKSISRRLEKKERERLTPSRELLAQSAPLNEQNEDDKLRARSASTASNSERRRRTRRRRGRKSGSAAANDETMNDMSFEDALHYLGTADPLTAQQEGYFREGQTWTEDQIGCEVQVVGGTHYFTPIAQERGTQEESQMPGKDQKWSGGTPKEGLYQEESEPLFNMTVEEFRPPTQRHIGITQSAPMGGRTTKENRHVNFEDLRENLKVIWSKTQEEQVKLKPEEEEKLDCARDQAEKLALAAISLSDSVETPIHKEKIKMNEKMQMKIKDQWESQTSTYQNNEVDHSKSRQIRNNTSVWEIKPEEQRSLNERSRENSPTNWEWGSGGLDIGMEGLSLNHFEPTNRFGPGLGSMSVAPNFNRHVTNSSSDSWDTRNQPVWVSDAM